MKATVVGAAVPAKTLRAACAKAAVSGGEVRVVGSRAWVELPGESRDAALAKLAESLATGLMVIDVDLPEEGDERLQASRATYRGVEEDVTAEARELLQERRAQASGRGFDDRAAASALAWALIGDAGATAAPASSNAEEQWARVLVDRLAADGLIELRDEHSPVGAVAHVLHSPGRDLGERLLATLIESTAIDEVFADAEQLAAAARATRPRR
jgi:hypothetical protein